MPCPRSLIVPFFVFACGEPDEDDTHTTPTDDTAATEDTGPTDTGDSGTTTLPEDIGALLVTSGGCSDAFIWGASADDTWALTFHDSSGIVSRAYEAEDTLTESYDMSMDYGQAPSLSVQHGYSLQNAFCNDVYEEPTIDAEWWIDAGTVTISVTPTGEATEWGEQPASATLTVDGATFSTSGLDPVQVEHVELTANIGWLPG